MSNIHSDPIHDTTINYDKYTGGGGSGGGVVVAW
jgi:hypothetical protein